MTAHLSTYVRYARMRYGPPEVMARLAQGEMVDPSEYFPVAPMFETGAERYAWLNKILVRYSDLRDTVTQSNGPLFGEAMASDTARLVCEQFHFRLSPRSGNRRRFARRRAEI